MRRFLSLACFAIGGFILTLAAVPATVVYAGIWVTQLDMLVGMIIFAAPFLCFGSTLTPGSERSEVGTTMMVAAFLGLLLGLGNMALHLDRDVQLLFPGSAQPLVTPLFAFAYLALLASLGWLLRQWGARRAAPPPDENEEKVAA
ncbi:MAG TPA: hypothetical protein VGD10_08320 [Allosphingosinicella sp.]|uniref:hypothetical protein n=1 Tax=Allosphingosinicella sp. TaxID=2823234 RepID=UPI002ED8844D